MVNGAQASVHHYDEYINIIIYIIVLFCITGVLYQSLHAKTFFLLESHLLYMFTVYVYSCNITGNPAG